MAKGFTVKASKAVAKKNASQENPWDYQAIKDRWVWKDDCVLSSRSWMFLYFLKNFLQLAF